MNPQTYAQMLALQQQGAPLTSQGGPVPQNAPMVPKYDSQSPLSEGSIQAVNAARKSMYGKNPGILSDLMGMVQNYAISGLRNSNVPSARAYGQALTTPKEEADKEASENYKMMEFLSAQEKINQEQAHRKAELEEKRAYRQATLEEQRRHHNMSTASQNAHAEYYKALTEKVRGEMGIDKENEHLQSIAPGAISYKGRTDQERSAFTKELIERANKPQSEVKILHSLDKINDIVKEYPDLSTSAAAAMFPGKYEGGIVSTASLKSMPHKKRVALEKLTKLSNDLIIKQIHGLGGQRASIFLEKIMQSSNPHYGLTPEAVSAIRDNFKEEYDKSLMDSKIARKALHGNYYVPMIEPEYLESEEKNSSELPPITDISNEELLKLDQ